MIDDRAAAALVEVQSVRDGEWGGDPTWRVHGETMLDRYESLANDVLALAVDLAAARAREDTLREAADAWRSVREYADAFRESQGIPTDADGLAQLARVIEAEADAADDLIAALASDVPATEPAKEETT